MPGRPGKWAAPGWNTVQSGDRRGFRQHRRGHVHHRQPRLHLRRGSYPDEASILAMKSWSHATAVRVPLNEAWCVLAFLQLPPLRHSVRLDQSGYPGDREGPGDGRRDGRKRLRRLLVLITDYAGDPIPFGAACKAILQALP
jgi:hypothetical protein